MSIPFTYEQAEEICEDFEDLEGTELVIRTDTPVRCDIERVCMAPYAAADKNDFVQRYLSGDTGADASGYGGDEYTVLVIGRNVKDDNEVIIQTIEEYVAANGVNYNFPG